MSTTLTTRPLTERAADVLRRTGNPFRNYFARNPDDELCSRYHVPELYAHERALLLGVVDLYRHTPTTHSEVVPILGNKGSGKTHLLHSIKHGPEGTWQLLVTPGIYQKDTEFLEYLLFQLIDTLLGGGKQKNARPLDYAGEQIVRGLLAAALKALTPQQRLDLFPAPGLGRWARKLGLGTSQALERVQWLVDGLGKPCPIPFQTGAIKRACQDAGLEPAKALEVVLAYIEQTEPRNTAGLMRRHILEGFAKAMLLGDESDLATFLTYGFAELEFQVRPTRQDLVLALFKAIMQVLQSQRIPVVFAFDQLEDLLLARRGDDAPRIAEAFFAGIVQAMHQLSGICFLIFAERGLWNRFVPSLDGYIQDRLHNPIHLPNHGTLQALRLEAPSVDMVRGVVEARLRPSLEQLPDFTQLPRYHPFTEEQIDRIARTEPTLRDMLQQFRQLFDNTVMRQESTEQPINRLPVQEGETTNRITPPEAVVKSVVVLQSSPAPSSPPEAVPIITQMPGETMPPMATPIEATKGRINPVDLWEQEIRSARRKLEPEGAITGATRELQAGLGAFLQLCHEHAIKVGPWRLSHVTPEWTFGDHPTYGALSVAHWFCKGGQPWKVGVGLFLGRGVAKPRDLGAKIAALEMDPVVIDHLILLRPEDDLALSGKSKTIWQEAERRGRHARLEPVSIEAFSVLYAFPRLQAGLIEALPDGTALQALVNLIQDKCEKLLEQVCMPIQG